ncbi:MAG: ATP-binding cassette domain-containing protein [Kiloniellales bacterium]
MEPNLFKYVWHHSKREQLGILLMVLLSFPFYYVSLELPKGIVNQGIQGQGFSGEGSTLPFLRFELPWITANDGAPVVLFDGFALDQQSLLLALSFSFLSLVFVNGGFKFWINTSKGRLGERMLRRLRYELSDRVLRFPLPQLRRMKQAEVATMIKDEVEPLGGFIGDAFVTPLFLGGQALTAMVFIMVQSFWLGLVAATIVLVQAFLIPRLRRRILVLGKMRQITARQLAGRIAELMDGAVEVHAHDTSNYERADLVSRLGRIFDIRYEIFQRKFFVKFLNNFLAQLTPFLFYVVGGLLAISGHLDIGALVAVIAAYKDLPGPIKELIDWDQQRNDVQIKYEQVIDQFQPAEIIDASLQAADNAPDGPLTGEIVVSGVVLLDDSGGRLLDSVGFAAGVDKHVAIIGDSASGKEHLGLLLAGLLRPSSGDITIGGRPLAELPQAVTGRRMSYVGPDAYLFPLSVRDNLLYGLRHLPPLQPDDDATGSRWAMEARRAGNPTFSVEADWVDYAAAGADGPHDINEKLVEVLTLVGLEENVYRFGLSGTIDPEAQPEVADGVLKARAALTDRLAKEGASDLVVRFDPDAYNPNATLAENLLFGTPTKPEYAAAGLARNPLLKEVLDESGLHDPMLDMGLSISRTMVEIFADLPPGHPFFEQFSFIQADDLGDYRTLVGRAEKLGLGGLNPDERERLMALPFDYSEARHRLGLIDETMQEKLVEARRRFARRLAEEDPGAVEAYRIDGYNAAASLQDNILFGRLAYGRAHAEETVGAAVTSVLDELGLREKVIEAGLLYNVGIAGKRLSATQRQRLAIGRALLKRPDVLILNEAAAVMDQTAQHRLMKAVLQARQGKGVIWTLAQLMAGGQFDRILVMRGGRIVEQGSFAELNRPETAFSEMAAAG